MPELKNAERARAIAAVAGAKNEYSMKYLLILIEALISETREENDRAGVRRVFRNQGKIEALQQLRDYIEGKSLPSLNKMLDKSP